MLHISSPDLQIALVVKVHTSTQRIYVLAEMRRKSCLVIVTLAKSRKIKDLRSYNKEEWFKIPLEICANMVTNYRKHLTTL